MSQRTIDINADVGEGFEDALLMPYLSSCSIACGGHAGTAVSIRESIELAKQYGVKIGAHPSYPDKAGFGRKIMDIQEEALLASLILQLQDFSTIASELGAKVHHVKPHGALYNEACKNSALAELVIKAIKYVNFTKVVYAPYQSKLASIAGKSGLKVKYEAFIDRNYNPDLTLVKRTDPNALVRNREQTLEQVLLLIEKSKVCATDGKLYPLKADTLCIHSDTTYALNILKYVTGELKKKGILPGK